MRILYVDINASFLNPTRGFLPAVLAHAGETCFFGPGYVDSETLRGGLARFIDSAGPFAIAVTNANFLFAEIYRTSVTQYSKFYHFSCPPQDMSTLSAIAAEFERLELPRVALLLESDYYNWTNAETGIIESATDYVIGFGPEFWRFKAELSDLSREHFAQHVTDAWAEWVHAHPNRVASTLHFVAESEFAWNPLAHRSHPWSIVGIQYHARKTARQTLQREGIKVIGETPLRRGMGLAKRLGLMRREPRRLQQYLNFDFRMRLEDCRYSYTCGSALDMPIRKFFEIPAAGAVLVCKPFSGFAAAGFQTDANAIVCDPGDIMDAHRMLEGDQDRAEAIADAGRRLVFEKHSLSARAVQFKESLSAMADRSFAGARWENGEIRVKKTV